MRIAAQTIVEHRVDNCAQNEALRLRVRPQQMHKAVQRRVQVEWRDLNRYSPCLDLGDVEDIVYQRSKH